MKARLIAAGIAMVSSLLASHLLPDRVAEIILALLAGLAAWWQVPAGK